MSFPSRDAAIGFSPAETSAADPALSAPEIEGMVMYLFDQLHTRLSTYVLGFGLSFHDAEDIVQETFVSLFGHLNRNRPRTNLQGWLFRVAHNLALKKRSANRALATCIDQETAIAQRPDTAHNAEQELSFNQMRQRLLSVFEALPELDRRCLQLRAEGLKYREIARVLGISLGGVSLSLSRSLARMSRATEGE
jgi:RNA polymerase sigma-70 factor (ECF subfamily)